MKRETQRLVYEDFDLSIEERGESRYSVKARSLGAEFSGTFNLPFDDEQLRNILAKFQDIFLSPHVRKRKISTPEEKVVQGFGGMLFDALISGEIRSGFDLSQHKTKADKKCLRIKLRINPPELMTLPWEYLFDQRKEQYLSLSLYSPIVRYINLPEPAEPMLVIPPLRILVMIANPKGCIPLDVDREQERIKKAFDELIDERQVEVVLLSPSTWRDLQWFLRSAEYHIFHFVGHGEFDEVRQEGVLILEDERGRPERMHAEKLARLLADQRALRLAVLNACESGRMAGTDVFSSTAASLVRAGLPAVVAMQFEITDKAAIELAHIFYGSVAEGLSVDAALAEARKSISIASPDTFEWGFPVLYTHAPEGRIFEVPPEESRRIFRDPLFADAEARPTDVARMLVQEGAQRIPWEELVTRAQALAAAQRIQSAAQMEHLRYMGESVVRMLRDLVEITGIDQAQAVEIVKELIRSQKEIPTKPQADETQLDQ
ncbi:MAG: CHAT domain-containing protein [Anaerolineae bacterium]|nr:MAG: CHAT domain-containing protein [Anaerolineae bacterium]